MYLLPIPNIDFRRCVLHEGSDWFIYFYVKSPVTGKLQRVRIKCNRIKPLKTRRRAARETMAAIDQRLAMGWNPLIEKTAPKVCARMFEAFDAFLEAKDKETEPASMRSYRSFVKTFRTWLERDGYDRDCYCSAVTAATAQSFMDDMESSLSAKTYNNYVAFFNILFNWLVSKGYSMSNPFEGIKKKPRRLLKKTRRILTDDELSVLVDFLSKENREYLAMCMLCYCCLIRPKEIVLLKCSDVDLDEQTVHVRQEIAKNDNDSTRTIPDDLVPLLKELDLSHPQYYLFSDHGNGNFSSGTAKLCSRRIAQWWDLHVRPACGFGMDLKFYSLKDTGITNMLSAGVPVNIVQQQADHSSLAVTSVYVGRRQGAAEAIKKTAILKPEE